MSTQSPSRSPGTPVTLADVVAHVLARVDLPLHRRQDLASAVRAVCRSIGKPPGQVAADPVGLGRSIALLTPADTGVSPGRLRNIKSLVGKTLELAGVTTVPRRSRQPLSAAWTELLEQLVDPEARYGLSRFARSCSGRGIEPSQVDDTVANQFGDALATESLVTRPKQMHRTTCITWNQAVDTIPDWPQRTLEVPERRRIYAVPLSTFPASFGADLDAFLANCAGEDLLDDDAAHPASPATIGSRRKQLLAIAAALVQTGRDPQTVRALDDLVEVGAAKTALKFFLARKQNQKTGHLHNLARVLVTVARHWVEVEPDHLAELQKLRKRVDPGKTGLTAKNRARLRQFDDQQHIEALVRLPQRVFQDVRKRDRGGVADAVKIRDALALALLLVAPIRIKNLAGLDLERHLVRTRPGRNGIVHLVIPAREVKNKNDLEFELPAEVVELLDIYVERYRPRLVSVPSPWLFPALDGGPKAAAALGAQITKMVKAQAGLALNPHLVRHLAAKLILDDSPGAYETVRQLLRHKSLETTVRFYCGAEEKTAFRQYDGILGGYRDTNTKAKAPARRG
jgi:integrase